ncbi:hypothetical protein ThidrDRAFT_1512 [Thiorhodococcus drewsii AZ1]|uniref:Uncharacterized protein n=1 Tax=Thiorhodococcus drewsii AZ1 TaxID=765913 RepID=G2DZP9_9GAMM|nr:hypothetical protein ThidrDRAFT_1512 [Thiorhodococcus drewsii AZ1]
MANKYRRDMTTLWSRTRIFAARWYARLADTSPRATEA